MPPKKKQEEIDLSTLPQCLSINIFLFCKGKQDRAKKILNKIDTKFNKNVFHATKASVMDYAKQKNIYVDPETLTDKQKKDPKFMESICTQLTPQVLAKATDAYINNQNVKIRLEKKALADKPVQGEKKNKIDAVYIFDDFPVQTADFEALFAANQGIKYIFVIDPKISWVSAPEQPEPAQDPDQQQNQPDQQYQNFKKLKQAQTFTPQDQAYEKSINQKVQKLKNTRKASLRSSPFRNTVIDYIKCSIDPYNQQATIEQSTNQLLPRCEQLLQELNQFNNWVKDKQTQKLPEKQDHPISSDFKYRTQQLDNTLQVLNKLIKSFSNDASYANKNQQLVNFDDFDFQAVPQSNENTSQERINDGQKNQFIRYNQRNHQHERDFAKELLKNMKYPGVDRFMLPQVPAKSQGVRKLYRSTFGQFLPQNWNMHDFERKLDILQLQAAAKQIDQQRPYSFGNKIYEQQHTKQSLLRQLNKAFLFDQSTVAMKYNENNDKLYICMLYKNPARRMTKKNWQCNWKVLPNFQSWLKYFKQNQNNLSNTNYYDIDYESIGNIQEQSNIFSVKDAGAIIRKTFNIAGRTIQVLYCIAGHNTGELIFGLRNRQGKTQFYAQNQIAMINLLQNKSATNQANERKQQNANKSVYITFKDHSILQFRQNGDVIIRKPNQNVRLLTRQGYTIIYGKQSKNIVYHPNGGISHPPQAYINQFGKGIKNSKIYQVSTLKRLTQEGKAVTRRDDQTVIVQHQNQKWIKFADNTQYLISDKGISIEKQGFPLFKLSKDNSIFVSYHGAQIKSQLKGENYEFQVSFNRISTSNKSKLIFNKQQVQVFDGKTDTPFVCNTNQKSYISKSWEEQSLTVSFRESKYQRNSKQVVDPQQDQQNYGQQDVLNQDYLEPRVFIVNNDSTGVQLISQNQLKKGYFQHFEEIQQSQDYIDQTIQPQLKSVPHHQFANKSIIHGITPIPHSLQLNKPTIKKHDIKLDVYKSQSAGAQQKLPQKQKLQIRSLIKHKQITSQDRQIIQQIMKKRNEWFSKSQKQDNQFGFKPRNDPSTLERFQSKRKIIDFRKLKQQQILSQKLKYDAIQIFDKQVQNKMEQLAQRAKQEQIRRRLSKKKSLTSHYPWKDPVETENNQGQNYHNQQGRFYTNYFETLQGKKALSQMPDWVLRPKETKKHQQLDPEIRSQLNATMNKTKKQQQLYNNTNQDQLNQQSQKNQRYDTVQVQLKPKPQVYIKPSVFTQRQIDQERFAFQTEKKAYQYHQRKRKDYNVYGSDRKDKVQVPSLMRTQPVSELNQKYLVTEAPVDKKVKISSMKNKLTSEASNMTQMRKQGPHANLIRTIDKGNDYSKLLQKRTMMVQADLNDRLQRDIQINPIEANFGIVKQGGNYQLKIQIKNEDVLAQRIQLKKPKSIFCKVQMVEMGPIALGMTRKVSVFLKAAPQIAGKFTDEFDIITKHQIYHIPIVAQILSKNQFQMTGSMLSKTVRQFQQVGKKKREQLPPIKGAQ